MGPGKRREAKYSASRSLAIGPLHSNENELLVCRLLNFILTEKHGYRCAVILNEFGDSAGIERAILNDSQARQGVVQIAKPPGESIPRSTTLTGCHVQGDQAFELQDWVELSNGCACCSVKNDFIKALEGLMAKSGRYDYVLIETTGALLY